MPGLRGWATTRSPSEFIRRLSRISQQRLPILQCRLPVFGLAHRVDRPEPLHQGGPRLVKDRARGERNAGTDRQHGRLAAE